MQADRLNPMNFTGMKETPGRDLWSPTLATKSRRKDGAPSLVGVWSKSMRRIAAASGLAALLLVAGCRQDMQDQPKMVPQRGTEFFADHRGARPQVLNTVARGQLREDSYFYTGVVPGADGYREEKNEMPFPVTLDVLKRGQERFNIYCAPCHSRVGNGLGEIVERGYKQELNVMPFPVTMEVLKRGQERFNVYRTPCHSRVGNGLGEIV